MKRSYGKWIALTVKLLVLAGLVYFIRRNVDSTLLMEQLRGLHPGYLLASFACMVMVPVTMGWRLAYVSRIPVRSGVACLIKAFFFNLFLPAQVGGDLYKIYYLTKAGTEKKKAVGLVFTDRLIGMAGGVIFAVCNVLFGRGYFTEPMIYRAVAVYILIVLSAFFMIFVMPESLFLFFGGWKPVSGIVEKVKLARDYLRSVIRLRVYGGLGITFVCYLFLIGLNVFAMLALRSSVDFAASFLYMPVISVISLTLPISFNGLGVRESLYILLFRMAGFTNETSLAMAGVHLLCIIGISVLGGIATLVGHDHIRELESETRAGD